MVFPRLGIEPRARFLHVPKKSTSLILRRKLVGRLTGGGGQSFNGRYSLTDHKKNPPTFPKIRHIDVFLYKKYI